MQLTVDNTNPQNLEPLAKAHEVYLTFSLVQVTVLTVVTQKLFIGVDRLNQQRMLRSWKRGKLFVIALLIILAAIVVKGNIITSLSSAANIHFFPTPLPAS